MYIRAFDARPVQIKALRRVLRWSRFDLGKYCGLYTLARTYKGRKLKTCVAIERWETGKTSPTGLYREKLDQLYHLYKTEYSTALRELEERAKHGKTFTVPYRKLPPRDSTTKRFVGAAERDSEGSA